jgi:hypothetical protein
MFRHQQKLLSSRLSFPDPSPAREDYADKVAANAAVQQRARVTRIGIIRRSA